MSNKKYEITRRYLKYNFIIYVIRYSKDKEDFTDSYFDSYLSKLSYFHMYGGLKYSYS
jgi:hypothetical protein